MPYNEDNEYEVPTNWDGVIHPECGNQADWVYAIRGALNERLAVNGGKVDVASFPVIPVFDSYMFFNFARDVERTIFSMLGEVVRRRTSSGNIIEIRDGDNYTSEEKWTGWLNPDAPVIVGIQDDDETEWPSGPWAYLSYNFLDGKQLLNMEGCDFREPLTTGYSSLETCFPVWFERVKNAINKLHVSPVPVYRFTQIQWGNGNKSNSDNDESGYEVDTMAWNEAVGDYGNHDFSPLPDGDEEYYSTNDMYYFLTRNYTEATRRHRTETFGYWSDRSTFYVNGVKVFAKRLYRDYPFGCNVYAGCISTTGTNPSGGQIYDVFFDSSHSQNEVFTIECGKVQASDQYKYIGDQQGWNLILDDTEKIRPTYIQPPIEPGHDTGILTSLWGHDVEGRFYADWVITDVEQDDDGFKFKELEEEEEEDPHIQPIPQGQG